MNQINEIPRFDFVEKAKSDTGEYEYSKRAGKGEQPLFISIRAVNGAIYQLHYHQLISREVNLFQDETKGISGYVLDLETSNSLITLYLIHFSESDFLRFEQDLQMGKLSRVIEYQGDIEAIENPVIKLHKVYSAKDNRPKPE